MLIADKADLRAELAVDVLHIREKEMKYYIRNMQTISTQATLMATLTFGIITSYDYAWPIGALPALDPATFRWWAPTIIPLPTKRVTQSSPYRDPRSQKATSLTVSCWLSIQTSGLYRACPSDAQP